MISKRLDFDFTGLTVNETLARTLASGEFLSEQRNAILIGGTGTGKSHLAIAIAGGCIRRGARGRFFNVVDLVNRLESEVRGGRNGETPLHRTKKPPKNAPSKGPPFGRGSGVPIDSR